MNPNNVFILIPHFSYGVISSKGEEPASSIILSSPSYSQTQSIDPRMRIIVNGCGGMMLIAKIGLPVIWTQFSSHVDQHKHPPTHRSDRYQH